MFLSTVNIPLVYYKRRYAEKKSLVATTVIVGSKWDTIFYSNSARTNELDRTTATKMQNKAYFDKGDPFEVHKKIKQEFNKLHKWVLKTSKYKVIVQLYEQVQQESYQVYVGTLEQLQIIQAHNSKYDLKINHVLSELEKLKQDYITNSQKLCFAKEYEAVNVPKQLDISPI